MCSQSHPQAPEPPGQEPFPPQGLGDAGEDAPPGGSRQGLPGPAELPGHKILKFAVGGGEQGPQVGRAQEFGLIPGQVPPG